MQKLDEIKNSINESVEKQKKFRKGICRKNSTIN